MILRLIIWAMATGFVTGAVWFAIHFLRRGGSIPLALRGEERYDAMRYDAMRYDAMRYDEMRHDALTPGSAESARGYPPIPLADQDSRKLQANVKPQTGEAPRP